jgi:hypothetical protein
MEFKQQMIIEFLMTERSGANEILVKLSPHFEGRAFALRNARSCMRGVERRIGNFVDRFDSQRPPSDDIEMRILSDAFKSSKKYFLANTFNVPHNNFLPRGGSRHDTKNAMTQCMTANQM